MSCDDSTFEVEIPEGMSEEDVNNALQSLREKILNNTPIIH